MQGMHNDIREVPQALNSHHSFVGVFPDQLKLLIDESPDSQDWCNQISELRNSVTQMSVALAPQEPGPETQTRNTIN